MGMLFGVPGGKPEIFELTMIAFRSSKVIITMEACVNPMHYKKLSMFTHE